MIVQAHNFEPSFVKNPVIAFLGSGISIWKPTRLPTGKAFADALFRAMFDDSETITDTLGEKALKQLFSRIPFEIIMERCPDPQLLADLLIEIFNTSAYNEVHRLFAETLITGAVGGLITTNYDCCLDRAIADIINCPIGRVMGPVTRIFGERDLESRLTQQPYFKIHGSADDPTKQSLIFQLRHESALPKWKRELLKDIVPGRTLLLIGYSGLDFEICPEIPLLQPAQVLWNVFTERDITPNARMVVEKTEGQFICGDMRILLSRIFRPVNAKHESSSSNVETLIRSKFASDSLRLWRVKVLNNLSYGKRALIEINRLKQPAYRLPTELLDEQARAFHYVGAYKRAARAYERIAVDGRKTHRSSESVYEHLLSACDNWRCYGAFLKARKRLIEAEQFARRVGINRVDVLATANLKRILLLRRNYQIAELLRLQSYKDRVKARAAALFKSSAEALLTSGRWFELQQLKLWADRFDLPSDATRPPNMYDLPPAREGYEHLGFPMAQMMVLRDELDTGRRPLDSEAAHEVIQKADLAERLGLRTEAWKLNYMLLRKFPNKRNFETLKKFIRCFLSCEYSLLMRCLLLVIRP